MNLEDAVKPLADYCIKNGKAFAVGADGSFWQIGGKAVYPPEYDKLMKLGKHALVMEILDLQKQVKRLTEAPRGSK